jgi:hypothetical protein
MGAAFLSLDDPTSTPWESTDRCELAGIIYDGSVDMNDNQHQHFAKDNGDSALPPISNGDKSEPA